MIFRSGPNAIRLACDECDREPANVGFLSFKEASTWARDNHWHVEKDKKSEEWSHICPDCAREIGIYPPDTELFFPVMPQEPPKAVWEKLSDIN